MKYVIDSNILIDMKHFYPRIFPALWNKMNVLVASNELTSRNDFISEWAEENETIFVTPNADEFITVTEIMSKHRELVKNDSISGGRAVADPFLIAKAKATKSILITNETFTPNAHKIPNVCKEYDITVMNLEEFMVNEEWQF
jgi:hypothetical protein